MSIVPEEEFVVDEHRKDLLDEQGIALCRLRDAGLGDLGEEGHAEQVLHEQLALWLGEGLELDGGGVQLPSTPPRSDVEQLLPGDRQEQDGGVSRPVGDVVD